MSTDTDTSFLTNYIQSLGERTREEKAGTFFGFDTIIYNLALAKDWKPIRLPFLRQGANRTARTKPEAEFGVDLSFLTPAGKQLFVFALKDEPLVYSKWTSSNFDSDLRHASTCDLSAPDLKAVKKVTVVLAYNKDEDQRGIDCFNKLVQSLPKKCGRASLKFERWNLSEITDQVKRTLMSPSLLPAKFFGRMQYICAQVGDFTHGSDKWHTQLIPNWRGFLAELLEKRVGEKSVRMVSVALLVVRAHMKNHASAATGFIDLVEWSMLAIWRSHLNGSDNKLFTVIRDIWAEMYLQELERFYLKHSEILQTEHSLGFPYTNTRLDSMASSYIALWHVARLGILSMAYGEIIPTNSAKGVAILREKRAQLTNTLVGMLNANSSACRATLDLHHINLFLIWRALRFARPNDQIEQWLHLILERFTVRRWGYCEIPFISTNTWEEALKASISDVRPTYKGKTSALLQMLLELSCDLEASARDAVMDLIQQQLLHPEGEKGTISPLSWIPPDEWEKRILEGPVGDGIGVTVQLSEPRSESLMQLVKQTREKHPFKLSKKVPASVLVLACLKNESPLPSEIWRGLIWPIETDGSGHA